jgi:hypothetical protein
MAPRRLQEGSKVIFPSTYALMGGRLPRRALPFVCELSSFSVDALAFVLFVSTIEPFRTGMVAASGDASTAEARLLVTPSPDVGTGASSSASPGRLVISDGAPIWAAGAWGAGAVEASSQRAKFTGEM